MAWGANGDGRLYPSGGDHAKCRAEFNESPIPVDASEAPKDASPVPALPDRLSTDPRSPYHHRELIERGVGIRFNGKERFDISEYCLSEGWVKVAVGKSVDRRGQPLTIKLKGEVEAFLR